MHVLPFLLVGLLVPNDDPAQKEMTKFQGVWKASSVEYRGRPLPPGSPEYNFTLVVGKDGYTLSSHAGTLKLDPAKRTVDLVVGEGRYKGTTIPGVYEFDGDTLKLAVPSPAVAANAERPKDFKTDANASVHIYAFERDKTATKEQIDAKLKERRDALALQAPVGGRIVVGSAAQTQEMLKQIMEKLDRIEKRLDALEKKGMPPEKK